MNTAGINKIAAGFPQISTVQRKVKNPHLVQFYINTGQGAHGPWIAIGINNVEYILGFVKSK